MISEVSVRRGIGRLESVYGSLEPDSMEEYVKIFKNKDEYVFNKAIVIVLETHKTSLFPKPGEIMGRYQEAVKTMPKAPPDQNCRRCLNMGQWIDPEDGLAKPCPDCEVGKRLKRSRTIHDKRYGHWYTRAKAQD